MSDILGFDFIIRAVGTYPLGTRSREFRGWRSNLYHNPYSFGILLMDVHCLAETEFLHPVDCFLDTILLRWIRFFPSLWTNQRTHMNHTRTVQISLGTIERSDEGLFHVQIFIWNVSPNSTAQIVTLFGWGVVVVETEIDLVLVTSNVEL